MDPRIDKLLRQRDLLREHLSWIEEEIVAAQSGEASATRESQTESQKTVSVNAVTETTPVTPPKAVDTIAEAVVPEPDTRSVHRDVRAGCMLYFGIATAAFGLLIAYIYWRY